MNPRTLAEMHNRPTAYEVVARHEDGSETRLAFTERHTKSVLLQIAQQNGAEILAMLGTWDGEATYGKDSGWVFGPVRICFSGRTERAVAALPHPCSETTPMQHIHTHAARLHNVSK